MKMREARRVDVYSRSRMMKTANSRVDERKRTRPRVGKKRESESQLTRSNTSGKMLLEQSRICSLPLISMTKVDRLDENGNFTHLRPMMPTQG